MADATYYSTIVADRTMYWRGESFSPDSGGELAGNPADQTLGVFWDLEGVTYRVDISAFGFDLTDPTSGTAPGRNDIIESVALQLYTNEHGNLAHQVEVYAFDWGEVVDASDWRTVAQLQALYDGGDGVFASYTVPAGWGGAEGAHIFTAGLDAVGAVSTALGGVLRLIIVSSAHRSGGTPTGRGYLSFRSANYETQADRPRLHIEYTEGEPPSGGAIPVMMHHLKQQGIS